MSTTTLLNAELREAKGTGASRRLRLAGKVPAVMYGAGRDPVNLSLDHDEIFHNLENESFHTAILEVRAGGDSQQAILRDVQMHPFKPRILHVDLQRVSATEKLHMKVPLHFIGEDTCPGVKTQGGLVSHLMTEVDVTCLPSQLPEYIEADVSNLNLNESLHLSELKLPEGVEITSLAHGGEDHAIASVQIVRHVVEEEVAEGEEVEAEAEAVAPKSEETPE